MKDITKDEFLDLKSKYTYMEISNITGLTIRQLSYKAKNWGLNFSNKKSLDNQFFSRQEKKTYYWAGFIAADGHIEEGRSRLGIGLAAQDIDHLYKFKKAINSEHDVCSFMNNKAYRIRFNSKIIVQDLSNNFNITGNKTYTFKFPLIEEDYLLWEFIRGYVDGDGHLEKTASGKIKLHLCSAVKETLVTINDVFSILVDRHIEQQPKLQVNKKGSCYSIVWTVQDSETILHTLYKNSSNSTRLNRKYATYLSTIG